MPLEERDWQSLFSVFKSLTGVDLNLYKQEQLRRRTLGMIEARGCKDLAEFAALLKKSPENVRWFQDKLAINVSELFRNPEKWAELETKVLPELLQRTTRLKCWSAGCSYGAEAHSLAAILEKRFPGNHTVIGTDIDDAALTQARTGRFSDADMRGVPAEYREYFAKVGNDWQASNSIRKYLTFKKANLLTDTYDTGFDLVMCRNVVIYFNDQAKDDLYQRFFSALKPGGVLFVGSTERIFNSREIGFEQHLPFFYRKPLQGDRVWRSAS
ncbi:MAG: protein-glutamate O-methyltransferase CheR [Fimbriimonadaceae bacterium]